MGIGRPSQGQRRGNSDEGMIVVKDDVGEKDVDF